jgi:hypothetical protein
LEPREEDAISLFIVIPKNIFLLATKLGGDMTPPDIQGGMKDSIPEAEGAIPEPKRLFRRAAFFPMKMSGSTNGATTVGFTGRNGFKDRYGLIGLGAGLGGTALYMLLMSPAKLRSSPGKAALRFWAMKK